MSALGWKLDPVDERDHDAAKLLAQRTIPIPAETINDDLTETVDQGRLGACTSFSSSQGVRAAQILEIVESRLTEWTEKGNPPDLFDAAAATAEANRTVEFWAWLFPYYLARSYDHTTGIDVGTNIRTIFKVINKYGFPPLSSQPYNDNTDPEAGPTPFSEMPPSDAFREAFDQRLTYQNIDANVIDYARISATGPDLIYAIKQACAARHLVVFGTDVTEAFCSDMTANDGQLIERPKTGEKIAGGHALVMGGYDANGPKILNSWGKGFGGRRGLPEGWCRFTWDYITWPRTNDFWIVRRAPILLPKAA